MNFDALLGTTCVISFTLPLVVIFYNRYYTHRSLAALAIYYFIMLVDNFLSENIIHSSPSLGWTVNLIDNYTNIPLVITALSFFCPSKRRQGKLRMLALFFLAYEIAVIAVCGFTINSIIYIMGPGIAIVLTYSFYLFVRQVKFSIYHGKNHGRAVMLAAFVFDWACYSLIYIFDYLQKTPYQMDIFRLYYISSIISSVLMAVGLHMMRTRMKELKSLKTTRKELALIFGH